MPKDKALSGEDRILWGKVARSARAMPGKLEALSEFEAAIIPAYLGKTPQSLWSLRETLG